VTDLCSPLIVVDLASSENCHADFFKYNAKFVHPCHVWNCKNQI